MDGSGRSGQHQMKVPLAGAARGIRLFLQLRKRGIRIYPFPADETAAGKGRVKASGACLDAQGRHAVDGSFGVAHDVGDDFGDGFDFLHAAGRLAHSEAGLVHRQFRFVRDPTNTAYDAGLG
jgi:hypothetical protein